MIEVNFTDNMTVKLLDNANNIIDNNYELVAKEYKLLSVEQVDEMTLLFKIRDYNTNETIIFLTEDDEILHRRISLEHLTNANLQMRALNNDCKIVASKLYNLFNKYDLIKSNNITVEIEQYGGNNYYIEIKNMGYYSPYSSTFFGIRRLKFINEITQLDLKLDSSGKVLSMNPIEFNKLKTILNILGA